MEIAVIGSGSASCWTLSHGIEAQTKKGEDDDPPLEPENALTRVDRMPPTNDVATGAVRADARPSAGPLRPSRRRQEVTACP